MSGIQRLFLDWSNSTVRAKHFSERKRAVSGGGGGAQATQSTQSRILSSPANKVSQWQTSVARNTVCKKYKESMGFTSRTVFLSRGDPISDEVLKFLSGYDILIHESFGQSENSGLHTANIPKRYSRLGTTGKTVPGIKTKVSTTENMPKGYFTEGTEYDIGEVCCYGRNVFMGYLNRETETKEVIPAEDGWLNLGHLGYVDPDDYLTVHGKRENYVTLKTGTKLYPKKIKK
jgi:long-subunit acyl-CoA synthetase (AMP-forming)